MLPGSRLVSFITGRQPGLSEEARQGRKEVLWISASVWLPPIFTWMKTILAAPEGGRAGSLVPSIVVNTILFLALARGDPGARKFTLVMLIPAAIAHTISPFLPYAEAPGVLTGLFNGFVYGAAAYVLARSPAVQAYLDSQTGQIAIPSRAPKLAAGTRAATLPSSSPAGSEVKPGAAFPEPPPRRQLSP